MATEPASHAELIVFRETMSRRLRGGGSRDQEHLSQGGVRARCGRLPEKIFVQRLEVEHAGDQNAAKVPGEVATALPILRGLRGRHVDHLPETLR